MFGAIYANELLSDVPIIFTNMFSNRFGFLWRIFCIGLSRTYT